MITIPFGLAFIPAVQAGPGSFFGGFATGAATGFIGSQLSKPCTRYVEVVKVPKTVYVTPCEVKSLESKISQLEDENSDLMQENRELKRDIRSLKKSVARLEEKLEKQAKKLS